jgi:tRNA splicing endonuclease
MKNDEGTTFKNDQGTTPKKDETGIHSGMSENTKARFAARQARSEGLKRGVRTTVAVSFVILVTVGIFGVSRFNSEKQKQLAAIENQKVSYTELLTTRDSVINEWIVTFDQIEKDLNMVKEKENIITVNSSNGEFSKSKKERIQKDIEYINTVLDLNRKKIVSLTAQLKNSGGAIKGLQIKVAELEASMKLREAEVSELKLALVEKDFEIGKLNTIMTDQQLAIAQKDEKISNQINEKNKAYVAYGTYKDLKARGLVSKEGGFLGLGKKEAITAEFADSSFKQVNITELKEIPVNSKSAKLISEHPASSYEMITDADKHISRIEIKDPDLFWKISKYAVVEISN